ncbi:MAG TPA: hypothetical protein VFQ72_03680 [Candidatus Paceibacterota bacterium]|nr:hypothetical protein [Candidatus Paceibacterota bacterium]
MDTTIFLARVWGPIILAVGIGIFASRSYYAKVYRDLEKDALAALLFGIVAMAAGIVQILVHDSWSSFPQGLVSFLGWALLAKGIAFVVAPKLVDRSGDYWAGKGLIPVAGLLTLVGGAYLCWFAYLA